MDSAERLKREAASCWTESIDPDELIVVPGIGGARARGDSAPQAQRHRSAAYGGDFPDGAGEARKGRLPQGHQGRASSLTGGAFAHGRRQGTRRVGVRDSRPPSERRPAIGGLENEYRNPMFATAVGLVLLEARRADGVDDSFTGSGGGAQGGRRAPPNLGKIVLVAQGQVYLRTGGAGA